MLKVSLLGHVVLCAHAPNLFLLLLCSGFIAASRLPDNVTIPAILVFGDSIADQGNNNNLKTISKCNFPPYGKDFAGGLPTGRFCNGKTPPDMLAEVLEIKDLVPAYLDPNIEEKDLLTGVSFASGGAGFDPQTSRFAVCFSMRDQLEMLKEYTDKLKGLIGEDGTKHILENSLFVVIAGSNDLANTYFALGIRRLHYDINSYTDLLAQFASDFFKELYNLGARKIALHSIPPLGCLPSQRTVAGGKSRKCVEKYNVAARLLNTKLDSAVKSFGGSLSDANARVFFVDVYNPFLDIILNYSKYGFAVANNGCCGTGKIEVTALCNKFSATCPDDSLYVFWDSFHPTERAYKVLGDKIFQSYTENL